MVVMMLVVMFLIKTMIRRGYLNQLHKVARFNRHTAVSPRGELGSNHYDQQQHQQIAYHSL